MSTTGNNKNSSNSKKTGRHAGSATQTGNRQASRNQAKSQTSTKKSSQRGASSAPKAVKKTSESAKTPPTAPLSSQQVPAAASAKKSANAKPRNLSESGSAKTNGKTVSAGAAKMTVKPYHLPGYAQLNRVSVTEIRPVVEEGRWPAKAAVGELFPVHATVFVDGHAHFGADAVLLHPRDSKLRGEDGYDIYEAYPADTEWEVTDRSRMQGIGFGENQFEGWLQPKHPGRYAYAVESWIDPYSTWVHDATVKIEAGQDVELVFEEGARILERAAKGKAFTTSDSVRDTVSPQVMPPAEDVAVLQGAIAGLRAKHKRPKVRLAAATNDIIKTIMSENPLKDYATRTHLLPLRVDRERSLGGAWYEIFPRSVGAHYDNKGQIVPGNLKTAAEILPDVAADGFDVIYLTPIHPIGETFRKGANNSLTCGENDPGSPWAVGGKAGGHDAVNPDLGTIDDFDDFVKQVKDLGMEVALDFALQCSPDHPWVIEHPEWFSKRADGTIAYAENPPKKYQDIYPLNFDNDPEGLYTEIRRILEYWIAHGVTIFRMDNPHTKPVRFWQRLAADLQLTHPEVVMLAEAFTAPAMMRGLAQAGFHLSYTYFTWRNSKYELTKYFEELAYETAHVLHPALFPMTPDILTDYMTQGVEAFKIRAILAATAAPTWGILGGCYEFCEHVQRAGVEEVVDNPKYEVKVYDWQDRDRYGIATLNAKLNRIRAAHPALAQLRNIKFHQVDNDAIIAYSKRIDAAHSPSGKDDTVLVVVNLDAKNTQSGWLHLDLGSLGLDGETVAKRGIKVRDELNGDAEYAWGVDNFISLNPYGNPAHFFVVE